VNSQYGNSLTVHTGGKPVKLAYAESDDSIYVISTDFSARWPSHILRNGSASLTVNDSEITGFPALVTSPDDKEMIIGMFTNKYGSDYVSRYFSNPARYIRISMNGSKETAGSNYYTWLEEEFDSVADHYDNHIFGNRINMLLRKRSLEMMRKYSTRAARIIEIGCGTGAETLELLKDGHEVFALDISGRMLDNVREKANKDGYGSMLTTVKMRASDIGDILPTVGENAFDLGYSTYGALNCEPEIEKLPEVLSRLIKPAGYFVAGVYNKYCVSETLANIVSLKLQRLFWRFRNPISEGRSRFCIDVYSFSINEFMKIFGDHFERVETAGVPVILPPSNFNRIINGVSRKFDSLSTLDRLVSERWPWKYLGDHFLVALKNSKAA
jgi:ubiquinone/menaquinone biosynthesis C-methylase UbiE